MSDSFPSAWAFVLEAQHFTIHFGCIRKSYFILTSRWDLSGKCFADNFIIIDGSTISGTGGGGWRTNRIWWVQALLILCGPFLPDDSSKIRRSLTFVIHDQTMHLNWINGFAELEILSIWFRMTGNKLKQDNGFWWRRWWRGVASSYPNYSGHALEWLTQAIYSSFCKLRRELLLRFEGSISHPVQLLRPILNWLHSFKLPVQWLADFCSVN